MPASWSTRDPGSKARREEFRIIDAAMNDCPAPTLYEATPRTSCNSLRRGGAPTSRPTWSARVAKAGDGIISRSSHLKEPKTRQILETEGRRGLRPRAVRHYNTSAWVPGEEVLGKEISTRWCGTRVRIEDP